MKPLQNRGETFSSSCDLNIIVEGKQYGTHWRILRERSAFFDEFYRRRKAKRKPNSDGKTCVHLEGVSSRLVGLFLQHVYMNGSKHQPAQLVLHEINDVLKFAVMFGLKDLGIANSIDVEAVLKKSQQMSPLHKNLLKFLYVRTTRYKTCDIAKFVAHKAYIAADMQCLFDVLEIVSSDNGKPTMRLKLLDVLITIFTASLSATEGLVERNSKGHKDFVKGKVKETPFLRSGLIKFTTSPHHQDSGIKRKISFSQNSKITNHIPESKQQNTKSNKKWGKLGPEKTNHNFVTKGKAQSSYPMTEWNNQQTFYLKPSKATRTANRRIALIKENLQRIDEHFERENAQADMPKIRVVKEVLRAEDNTSRVDKFVYFRPEEHVLSNEEHVSSDQEHVLSNEKHVLGNEDVVSSNEEHVNNLNLAREYKEVSRDGSMISEKMNINEISTNMNDGKPTLSYEQEPTFVTRKVRRLWAKDIQITFPIAKTQDDNTNAYYVNPPQNLETQGTLNCDKARQNKTASLNEEEFEAVSTDIMKNTEQLSTKDNLQKSENRPLNPNENLEKAYPAKISSGNTTRRKIFLTGGLQKNDYFAHKAILEFNLETGSAKSQGAMQTGRYNHGAAQLGNEIYLVGGNSGFLEQLRSVESYSPEHAQWTTKPNMREARDEFSLAVCGGCLYAIGGHNGIQDLRSVEKFNARENSWSFVSPLRNYRAGACAVVVDDRYIYVIGGFNGQTYLTSAEQYDVTADIWIEIQPIRSKRAYSCAVLLERSIYILGGFDGQTALSSCEMFDIEAGTWEVLPGMNTPRMNATAVVYSGGLFVLGGECDSVFLETVECYNLKHKTWSFVNRLPQPMAGLRACIFLEETETGERQLN